MAESQDFMSMQEDKAQGLIEVSVGHCAFCGELVDPDNSRNYHEVTSWVHGPKLDGPKLREHTGRVAHEECIDKIVLGQSPDQEPLF